MEQNITKNPSFVMPIKDLEDNNYGYEQLDYLRELGASFIETHYEAYDKHFVTVILPEGYFIGDSFISNGFQYRTIYDANENERGSFFVKQGNMNVANLVMKTRYRVTTKFKANGENKFKVIYFGNEEEELFSLGSVPLNARHRSPLYIQSLTKSMIDAGEVKADLLYPDWRDPLAYWDEAPAKVNGPVLSLTKDEN